MGVGMGGEAGEPELTREQIDKIRAVPLPDNIQHSVSAIRGQFLGELSAAWDRSIEPLLFMLKVGHIQAKQREMEHAAAAQARAEAESTQRQAEQRAQKRRGKKAGRRVPDSESASAGAPAPAGAPPKKR